MDAMALLCTLHADGPTTLKRLRQAGCDSIEAVASFDPERLAKLLGATPASARRFLREAAHLSARLDTGFLEREEKGAEVHAVDLHSAEPPITDSQGPPTAPTRSAPPAREKPPVLGYRDQQIVAQVLQAWREHDSEETPPAAPRAERESESVAVRDAHSATAQPAGASAQPAGASDDGSAEAARAVHPDAAREQDAAARRSASSAEARSEAEAGAVPSALPTELFPGAVDGLDQETCLRLRRAGIHDVAMLARIDALALSKTLGVGFMRLARLCALARRRVAHAPASTAAPRSAHEHELHGSSAELGSAAAMSSEIKFSRAGNPMIGVLPALAQDLEIHAVPRSLLPSRTRWSPASAASTDGEDAAGPFA